MSGEKRTSGGAKGNTGPEAKDNWGTRVNSWPHVGRLRWTRATEVGNPHETGYELPAHQLMRLGRRPEGWKMGCLRSWLCYVILTAVALTARKYRYRTQRGGRWKERGHAAARVPEVIGSWGACAGLRLARRAGWRYDARSGGRRQMGRQVIALLFLLGVANVEAGEEEASERSMLFNTRGLAVSTAAAATASAAFFFAQAALSKLAFIAQAIEEKGIDFGALVELICDHKQARLLVQWFRSRGFGLVVATGERCHDGSIKHGPKVPPFLMAEPDQTPHITINITIWHYGCERLLRCGCAQGLCAQEGVWGRCVCVRARSCWGTHAAGRRSAPLNTAAECSSSPQHWGSKASGRAPCGPGSGKTEISCTHRV